MSRDSRKIFLAGLSSRHIIFIATGLAIVAGLLILVVVRFFPPRRLPPPSGPDVPPTPTTSPVTRPKLVIVGYQVQEQNMGPVKCALWRTVPSEDGCHLAWKSYIGSSAAYPDYREFVVVDGKAGPKFESIDFWRARDGNTYNVLILSPDARHVMYVVKWRKKRTSALVLDHKIVGEYHKVWAESLSFSPDSKRTSYAFKKGRKWYMTIDDQVSRGYDSVRKGRSIFSPDSRRYAYCGKKGAKWVCVVDGKEGPEYDDAWKPLFSPDSKHVAYSAYRKSNDGKKRGIVVLDGVEHPACNSTASGSMRFSPDSTRLAYTIIENEPDPTCPRYAVVVNGQIGPWYPLSTGNIRFSPDSKHLAYTALSGQIRGCIMDGKPMKLRSFGPCVFSPDSQRWAYVHKTSDDKYLMLVNGKSGKKYDAMGGPVFSPDSRHIAYIAGKGAKWLMVLDDQEGQEFDFVQDICFSPDSKHLAYRARVGKKWFAVLDGRPQQAYDEIGDGKIFGPTSYCGYLPVKYDYQNLDGVVFRHDGRTLAYKARKGRKFLVVIDGVEGPLYDEIINDCPVVHPDGAVEYFAVKQKTFYRVRHVPQTR